MTGITTFPIILHLFNSCRREGVWERMALETENGKETITFSTVSRPSTLPEDKDGTDGRRRKKPSKVKTDRERKEA